MSTQSPWAAMDALFAKEKEPTGPEWFTVAEFAARYDCSPARAHVKLNKLVEAGKVERWTGTSAATRRITSKFRAL